MGVISVRLDDETEKRIRDRGEKPGTFCRLAVMKELRRLEIAASEAALDELAIQPVGMTSVEMIRHDRDYGHELRCR